MKKRFAALDSTIFVRSRKNRDGLMEHFLSPSPLAQDIWNYLLVWMVMDGRHMARVVSELNAHRDPHFKNFVTTQVCLFFSLVAQPPPAVVCPWTQPGAAVPQNFVGEQVSSHKISMERGLNLFFAGSGGWCFKNRPPTRQK